MALDTSLLDLERSGRSKALTSMPEKFELFAREVYFRESWQVAVDVWGDSLLPSLQGVAALTLRPEAVLARKADDCLSYMADHGYTPLLALPVRYTRANVREIWRYQWNAATLDRMALGDLINSRAEPVLLLFRDDRPDPAMPASVRLAGLKGSALPWERGEQHLRTVMGAINRLIVMVHCSDEPIDIVRELGILFGRRSLAAVYRRLREVIAGRSAAGVETAVAHSCKRYPAEHLCVDAAVEDVLRQLTDGVRTRSGARAAVRAADTLRAARCGGVLSWRDWSRDLRSAGVGLREWSVLLAASHYIQPILTGAVGIISDSGRSRWLTGEGMRLPGPAGPRPRMASIGVRT